MKKISQWKGIICALIIIFKSCMFGQKGITCVNDNTPSIVSLNKQKYNSLHKHFNNKFTL